MSGWERCRRRLVLLWCRLLLGSMLLLLLMRARPAEGGAASLMSRHVLQSAICADGSPGHFYMSANTSSSDFAFFFQGGVGCAHSPSLCEELQEEEPWLFTSDGFPEAVAAYGFLSGDAERNRLYSTFNRVYVPYCTMDMYLLDTESPASGDLQFRGRPLLEEVLQEVIGNSTQDGVVVLGGSSAGSVGVFNAASWLLDTFDQVTELSVVLDSAFSLDGDGGTFLKRLLDYLKGDPSVAYSGSHCSEEFDGGPCCAQFECMLQRGYYPIADERLRGTFALSSAHASAAFQANHLGKNRIGDVEDHVPDGDGLGAVVWDAEAYRHASRTEESLRNLASLYPETLSVFSPSCTDQALLLVGEVDLPSCMPGLEEDSAEGAASYKTTCTYGEEGHATGRTLEKTLDVGLRWRVSQSDEAWKTLQVDGTSVSDAMEQWWEGRGDASAQVLLFDDCDGPGCNPSCPTQLLPGTRDETDGLLVWVAVLATLAAAMLALGGGIFAVVWGGLQWKRVEAIVAERLLNEDRVGGRPKSRKSGDYAAKLSILMAARRRPAKHHGNPSPILEWRNLSCWAPHKNRLCTSWWPSGQGAVDAKKQLLFSVAGEVPAGALCAVMGPSGSGKSTLLELLSGRRTVGRCKGNIMFEGKSIAHQQASYILESGYTRRQATGFLEGLSVFDNLMFAAMLRVPGTLETQTSRVETVLEETSLSSSRHEVASALSGGEKRLLNLALEILSDRRILFLDEPTYGLDAEASLNLMAVLKRLSINVTVVVAVSQPRQEIWQLFSHAVLLSGGSVVYCGVADRALEGLARYYPESEAAMLLASQERARRESPTNLPGGVSILGGGPPAHGGAGVIGAVSAGPPNAHQRGGSGRSFGSGRSGSGPLTAPRRDGSGRSLGGGRIDPGRPVMANVRVGSGRSLGSSGSSDSGPITANDQKASGRSASGPLNTHERGTSGRSTSGPVNTNERGGNGRSAAALGVLNAHKRRASGGGGVRRSSSGPVTAHVRRSSEGSSVSGPLDAHEQVTGGRRSSSGPLNAAAHKTRGSSSAGGGSSSSAGGGSSSSGSNNTSSGPLNAHIRRASEGSSTSGPLLNAHVLARRGNERSASGPLYAHGRGGGEAGTASGKLKANSRGGNERSLGSSGRTEGGSGGRSAASRTLNAKDQGGGGRRSASGPLMNAQERGASGGRSTSGPLLNAHETAQKRGGGGSGRIEGGSEGGGSASVSLQANDRGGSAGRSASGPVRVYERRGSGMSERSGLSECSGLSEHSGLSEASERSERSGFSALSGISALSALSGRSERSVLSSRSSASGRSGLSGRSSASSRSALSGRSSASGASGPSQGGDDMSIETLSSQSSVLSFGSDLASHGSQDGSRDGSVRGVSRDRGGVSGEGKHSTPDLRRPRPWPSGAQSSAAHERGRSSGTRGSVGATVDPPRHHRKQEAAVHQRGTSKRYPSNGQVSGGGTKVRGYSRALKEEGGNLRLLGLGRSSSFGAGEEEGEGQDGLSSAGRRAGAGVRLNPEAVGFAGMDARRSVPDTILDILVSNAGKNKLGGVHGRGASPYQGGGKHRRSRHTAERKGLGTDDKEKHGGTNASSSVRVTSISSREGTGSTRGGPKASAGAAAGTAAAAAAGTTAGMGGAGGGKVEGGGGSRPANSVWKVAAILLARSGRSGYGKRILWHFFILECVAVLLAASFRASAGESRGLNLTFSIFLAMLLPVAFMYHPATLARVRWEWSLSKAEVADGFYSPVCTAVRLVFDHLAVGVFGSFSVAGIMYGILWHHSIRELPASWPGMALQLSCGVTLVAWVTIALFDTLVVSSLKRGRVFTIGVSLSATWVLFSGTVLPVSSLPAVLRVVTYASPHYWASSFMLRVLLDGLDITRGCDFGDQLYCRSSFANIVANRLDLHEHSTGFIFIAVAVFATAGLAILAGLLHISGRCVGILDGLRRAKHATAPNSSSLPEWSLVGVESGSGIDGGGGGGQTSFGGNRPDFHGDGNTADGGKIRSSSSSNNSSSISGGDTAVAKESLNYPESNLLCPSCFGGFRLRWPGFIGARSTSTAASTRFPDSSVCSSEPSVCFNSSSPRFSSIFDLDDEASPMPYTPGTTSTRITAEALARGYETSRSPLRFVRGFGGWWSSGNGSFSGAPGIVDMPPPLTLPLPAPAASPSKAIPRPISMALSIARPSTMMRGRGPVNVPPTPGYPIVPLGASTGEGLEEHAEGGGDEEEEVSMPAVQAAGMSMAGMGARARMFAANKSGGGGKRGARVGPFTARQRPDQVQLEPFVRSPRGHALEAAELRHQREEQEGEVKEEWDPLEDDLSDEHNSPPPMPRTEERPFKALLPPFKPLLPVPEQRQLGSETQWAPDPDVLERRLSMPQLARKAVWQNSGVATTAPASPYVIEEEDLESGVKEDDEVDGGEGLDLSAAAAAAALDVVVTAASAVGMPPLQEVAEEEEEEEEEQAQEEVVDSSE